MSNHEILDPKQYDEDLRELEGTDRVSHTVINPLFKQLINNDAYIKGRYTFLLQELQNHKNTMSAHEASAIDFDNSGTGIMAVKVAQAIIEINERISDIIAQSGTSDTEVVDARSGYAVLNDRLNAIESASKYFWKEEHTIPEGQNSITLTNVVGVNHELEVIDTTYGVRWFEDVHWTRDGQIITFKTLDEDLTFIIKAV